MSKSLNIIFIIGAIVVVLLLPACSSYPIGKTGSASAPQNQSTTYVYLKDGKRNTMLHSHEVVFVDSANFRTLYSGSTSIEETSSVPLGFYDDKAGIIYVNSSLNPPSETTTINVGPHGSAGPRDMEPYRMALVRHEFGHALLCDYLLAEMPADAAKTMNSTLLKTALTTPVEIPVLSDSVLADLIRIYQNQSTLAYKEVHYTENFHEFFAESYARYLEDKPIPVEFRNFFDKIFY